MATCSIFRNVNAIKLILALFLQTCYFLGTIKSIGVYLPDLERTLGLTSTDIGLALGLFEGFAYAPGPVIAYLYRRFHGGLRRCLAMTGALLSTAGLVLSSLVTNSVQLAVCLSVAGIGSSLLKISLVLSLSNQSGEAFGTYYGIGSSGYAVGIALVPLIADYLMNIYGWRGSLMIIGGFMGHLIPLTMMVDFNVEGVVQNDDGQSCNDDEETDEEFEKFNKDLVSCELSLLQENSVIHGDRAQMSSVYADITSAKNDKGSNDKSALLAGIQEETYEEASLKPESNIGDQSKDMYSISGTCRIRCSEIYASGCRIFTDSIYNQDRWMILLMLVTLVFHVEVAGWYAFLIPRAVALGIPTSKVLCLPYSAAVSAFIGSLSSGLLLKSRVISEQCSCLVLTLLNTASLLVDIFVPRFPVMIVTSFVTSFSICVRDVLLFTICKERVDQSQFPVILASIQIVCAAGLFLGPFLCGYVADMTRSFNASFVFIAAVDFLVFVLLIPPAIAERLSEHYLN